MATIYWKAGDDIQGEVAEAEHEGWIAVDSFNFSLTRNVGFKVGQKKSNEGETVAFQPITISKELDSSSVYLQEQAFKKEGIEMTFAFVTQDGAGSTVYMEIKLTDAVMSSYAIAENGTGGMPNESIGLSFNKIETSYFPKDDNGEQGSPFRTTYDVTTQTLNG